ncbi:hypothetical protein [uncultured Campylobacter sp.]|nr:hypothetical protein [uncultured Campylobacter sp.]
MKFEALNFTQRTRRKNPTSVPIRNHANLIQITSVNLGDVF